MPMLMMASASMAIAKGATAAETMEAAVVVVANLAVETAVERVAAAEESAVSSVSSHAHRYYARLIRCCRSQGRAGFSDSKPMNYLADVDA